MNIMKTFKLFQRLIHDIFPNLILILNFAALFKPDLLEWGKEKISLHIQGYNTIWASVIVYFFDTKYYIYGFIFF